MRGYPRVWHNPNKGPCFGGGNDICIGDKCNEPIDKKPDWRNYCLPCDFDEDIGVALCGGKSAHEDNAWTLYFRVIDYEVYSVK